MDFTHSHIHSTNHRIIDPIGMWSVAKMERQIHCLEIHAYNSLLKAFIAQSEVLTWGKEGLLTQIRKELHITDSEHGEMLLKFNSDETIKRIREQRKMASQSHAQAYHNSNSTGHLSASSENSVIRLKDSPSSAFYPQKNIPHSQASSMPANNICPNGTMLKYNDNLLTVQLAHGKAEPPKEMFNYDAQLLPSGSGSVPKGNYHNKQPIYSSESPVLNNRSDSISPSGIWSVSKGNYHNKLPFYTSESPVLNNESDFIPPSGRGSVVKGNYHNKQLFYSSESPVLNNESDFILSSGRGSAPKGNYPNKQPFYSFESPVLNNESDFILPSGRGSAPKGNYQNKQPFYSSESPMLNNESNFIRLRSTYTIINGVENMLFNRENPEPVAIEIAKQTLHEQERDLLEAIGKLENVLEDDDDDDAPQNVQDFSGRTTDDCPFE
ncbi:Emsy N Terminus (ENT)/ plant Tudor domains-containing protein [Trifolium repens]|nr:Emsy N Terminus (ENT)/ plant Tudor domains-containing protein [Trifolium repens]